jgi:hypothetical protein
VGTVRLIDPEGAWWWTFNLQRVVDAGNSLSIILDPSNLEAFGA